MKRSHLTAVLLLICLALTGCTSRMDFMFSLSHRSDDASNRLLKNLVAALEAQDPQALRALFSPSVQSSAELDEPIQALLTLTEGRRLRADWDGIGQTGSTTHLGETTEFSAFSFDLYVDETPYQFSARLTFRDESDPNAVGLTRLLLLSDYLWVSETYEFPQGDGLHVNLLCATDYETRRIYGSPRAWNPDVPVITEESLLSVLQRTPTLEAVVEAFGPPADDYIWEIYPLPDENGEPRYAMLSTPPDGSVSSVFVAGPTEWIREVYRRESLPEPTPGT